MVIEVMGHKAGWIALYSGMAGGGDVILVPEIAYNIKNIGNTILERLKKGKPYSIVVVAEGIQTDGRKRAAEYIAQEIEYETGIETRETVLGVYSAWWFAYSFRPQSFYPHGRACNRIDSQWPIPGVW